MTTGAADILSRYQAIGQNSTLPRTEGVMEVDRLREVAEEFESLLVKQMLDSMRATRKKENDLVNGGMAEDIFEDMLYTEYSRLMSKTGNLGLSDMIVRQQLPLLSPAQVANAYQ
ncbi:MAG: muramidase [Spirochaetales bacterium]|nr:muramidase [Spirochaetales bacterium]